MQTLMRASALALAIIFSISLNEIEALRSQPQPGPITDTMPLTSACACNVEHVQLICTSVGTSGLIWTLRAVQVPYIGMWCWQCWVIRPNLI